MILVFENTYLWKQINYHRAFKFQEEIDTDGLFNRTVFDIFPLDLALGNDN